MRQKKGFSLVEILVATIILALVVGGSMATYISIRKLSKAIGYEYVAWNLVKDVLEFGEAGTFGHSFRMKYYYPTPTGCTIPDTGCSEGCGPNIDYSEGYKLKEWYFFCPDTNHHPFEVQFLGDILAKGMVPKGAPQSVVIYYKVETDPVFYGAYKETVEVSWKDEVGGAERKIVASVIPIRSVNDQLRLHTAEFWWD